MFFFSKFGSCLCKGIVKGFEAKEPGWGFRGPAWGARGADCGVKGAYWRPEDQCRASGHEGLARGLKA